MQSPDEARYGTLQKLRTSGTIQKDMQGSAQFQIEDYSALKTNGTNPWYFI